MSIYEVNMNEVTKETFEYARNRLLTLNPANSENINNIFADNKVTTEESRSLFFPHWQSTGYSNVDRDDKTFRRMNSGFGFTLLSLSPRAVMERMNACADNAINTTEQFEINGSKIIANTNFGYDDFKTMLMMAFPLSAQKIDQILSDHALTSAEMFSLWDSNGDSFIDRTERQRGQRSQLNSTLAWFGLDYAHIDQDSQNETIDRAATDEKSRTETIAMTADAIKTRHAAVLPLLESGWTQLTELPQEYLSDFEIVQAAVKKNGLALKYASADLRANPDIVTTAVQANGMALMFASDTLQASPQLMDLANLQLRQLVFKETWSEEPIEETVVTEKVPTNSANTIETPQTTGNTPKHSSVRHSSSKVLGGKHP